MLFPNRHLIHIHALLEPPLPLGDGDVIPAHLPLLHAAVGRERPVLEAVAAPPLAGGVAELVPELDRDLGVSVTLSSLLWSEETRLVVAEGEQLLAQPVAVLAGPLLGQEGDDLGVSGDEARAVAPDAGFGVGVLDEVGVSGGER